MYNQATKGNKLEQDTVAVSNAAVTLIKAANPKRVRIILQNIDDTNYVCVGGADVTLDEAPSLSKAATSGLGGTLILVTQAAVYGIAKTAPCDVSYLEEIGD